MCGLIGMIAKHQVGFYQKDADMFQQMLYADALRGWDATGVFGVTKEGNVDIKKQASAAGHFIQAKQFETFKSNIISKYKFVVGHNRKATHGEKRHVDAHPFWDKEEKICLVHNGMIRNHKEFCKESTVDSAAIANALAGQSTKEVIESAEGAFAFIWYDVEEKKLHFIRNKERPLFILETSTSYLLASEQAMAFWIAMRNTVKVEKVTEVKESTLYTVDLDSSATIHEGDVIEEKKKNISQTITQTYLPRTTGNTTSQTVHPIGVNAPEEAPDSYYYMDADFVDADQTMRLLQRRDRIQVMIDTYESPGDSRSCYAISCTMINVYKKFISIQMYVGKKKFDTLDLTGIFTVEINNMVVRDGKIHIYVNDPDELDYHETVNNMFITDAMWFDDRFPLKCDMCNGDTKWKDLKDCCVVIEDAEVSNLLCPKCSGGIACDK